MTAAASDPARRVLVPAGWRRLLLGALSLAFFVVGFHQAQRDAPTVDEGVDLSSGVTALVRHDLRLVPEHPPLPRVAAALPALVAGPVVPDTAAYRSGDWFDYSDDFISANARAGALRPMLVWARSVVLLEAIGCGALVYLLARRSFGPDGGLLAAGAWLTTPYVVGLAHFAMIDVAFTLATLGVSLLVLRWREEPTMGRAVALGTALGASLATRHTALVLLALVVGVLAWTLRRDRRDAARQVAVVGSVAVAVVWLVYRGLAPGGPPGGVAANFDGLIASAGESSVVTRLVTALPLPQEWRAGFAYLDLTSVDRPSSLFGTSWDGGRWWYFPASAALKLPATLVLAVLAGWLVAVRDAGVARRRLALGVALPAVALWMVLVAQPLNLGLRLALPVVALALVGVGALARPFQRWAGAGAASPGRLLAAVAVALVALVQVVALVAAAPHSLAWTPVPWTPAYRWVSDSNLDAGQGLYEVRDWARHRSRPHVAIDSTRGMSVGGGSRSLAGADPAEVQGWVAVGVTPLVQTRRHELAWLRKYCPVGSLAGGSVLVYRFDGPADPTPGPERPVAPCNGANYSRRT